MDMSKYREMFLAEAKEHLSRLASLTLALEKNPGDRAGIDALFREAHSIKGMAASMGYERTTAVAHHLEDFLDGCRRTGEVTRPLIDRLLAGTDLLEALVEDLEAGRPEREIGAFLANEGAPAAVAAPAAQQEPALPPLTGEPIELEEGEVLQVTVRFAADAVAPAARALLALRELAVKGRILSSQPSEEDLGRGAAVSVCTILVETASSPEALRALLAGMSDVERVTVAAAPQGEHPYRFRQEDALRSVRVSTEMLDRFINLTGELITNRYILQTTLREGRWRELRERLDEQARLIGDLHHQVLRVRMLSLESITGRLPRLVRELARKTGKEVGLRLEGQEVEVDRAILEVIADPLIHLVRNAVDHGIEAQGEVVVRAWREKDQVLVEVRDNGRGMDPQRLRRKAVEQGVITAAQAQAMPDRDALHLICTPGFSTAAEITETSGRGVGMDVVRSAVVSLGGTLDIDSAPGRGTRFLLRLPLSVAIVHLLLAECDGHQLGIPFSRVLRVAEVSRGEMRANGRQAVLRLKDEEIPLLSLRKILGLPPRPNTPGAVPVVVTEVRGRKVGLVVDRLAGQRQAFIKSLSFPLNRLPGVSGATILGNGSVIFVIDPPFLLDGRSGRSLGRQENCDVVQGADGRAA